MKGITKLYPAKGKIIIGSIVRYQQRNYTVKLIANMAYKITNGDITIGNVNVNDLILLKYYIVAKSKIIGELAYEDYSKIDEGDKVNVSTREILNKMELNDKVRLNKLNICHNLTIRFWKTGFKKPTGIIVQIKGRYATIKIDNSDEEIILKRHMFQLINKNIKTICKIE